MLLTQGVDGEPADLGIERSTLGEFVAHLDVSRDGARVTFTSLSTNLIASATTIERRLFQIVLPPVQRGSVGRPLLSDESVCVPAIGAAPGEYVGVNVTPVGATAPGYGVLHSSDRRADATSTVNFAPGTVDPNVTFVRVGVDGAVCFTNSRHGPVDVVLDEMTLAGSGVFGSVDPFFPVDPLFPVPRRALDTRLGDSAVQPGAQECRASVIRPFDPQRPDEDVVIGVNTTPVGAVAPGYGTVHTYLMSPGAASTVNFGPGTVDPNFSFVQTFSSRICFTNSQGSPVHVVIDQMVADHEHALRTPPMGADGGRPVDTRIGVGATRLGPSGSVCFAVAGSVAGEFVGVNVTPVGATTPGFGTVHPSGSAPGRVSNVNFGPGTVDPNFAMTRVGADGRVCFTNSVHGAVDVVIDAQVIGAADAFRLPSAGGSVRILDTREARP